MLLNYNYDGARAAESLHKYVGNAFWGEHRQRERERESNVSNRLSGRCGNYTLLHKLRFQSRPVVVVESESKFSLPVWTVMFIFKSSEDFSLLGLDTAPRNCRIRHFPFYWRLFYFWTSNPIDEHARSRAHATVRRE